MAKTPNFRPDDWLTPNSYNNNFKEPPKKPGVYLLVIPGEIFIKKRLKYKVVYVGSSKNLSKRYSSHEVIKKIREQGKYVQFYFKELENHIEEEKSLIKLYQPKYNKRWL